MRCSGASWRVRVLYGVIAVVLAAFALSAGTTEPALTIASGLCAVWVGFSAITGRCGGTAG